VLGQTASAIDADIASLTDKIGDDALQQNADMQNMLQSQQQLLQMLSNISNNTSIPGPPDGGVDPSPSSPSWGHRNFGLGGLTELFSNMQSNMNYDPNMARGYQDSAWEGSTNDNEGQEGEGDGDPVVIGEPIVEGSGSSGGDSGGEDTVAPGPPPSSEDSSSSVSPGTDSSINIDVIASGIAGQSEPGEGPANPVTEMGDPDDLNQARERPDESPEGKAEDAVEDALDKATVAEGAAEAAERAEIKAQEAAKNHAQDTAALKEAIHEETNANEARAEAKLKYTYAQEHSSSDIEERREEYYDLCDKHNEAKESVEEAESKYYESHAEAEAAATAAAEAADAAAHAQAEAEAASAAAREAIANAQNKSSTGENHSDGGIPSTGLSPELESQLNTLSSKITPSSSTDGPTGG